MKRLTLIFGAALAACNPPVDATTGEFEEFSLDRVQPVGCVFTALGWGDPGMAVFATREGDLDHMAYVRFKGETLKLVPREVPDFSGENIDVTYDVVDYLKWKVRLNVQVFEPKTRPVTYSGDLKFEGLDAEVAIVGSCGR